MIYLVGLLFILLLSLIIYISFYKNNLRTIIKQLNFILNNETNQNVQTNLKDRTTKDLISLINRNINERKNSEQKSITLEKNLRSLINNVTHDLRTPLTVAKGYLQMVENETLDSKTKDNYIHKTNDSLNKLNERINILFEYTKLQEQKTSIEFEKVNLSSLLQEQVLLLYQKFEDQAFKMELDIENNIDLFAHPASIKSMIQNILDNVLNHGCKHIQLSLKKENNTIKLECKNKTKQVSIDTDAIFQRFYTEDMSRNNQNTGLGLPIIKDFVLLHFGDIDVSFDDSWFTLTIVFKK